MSSWPQCGILMTSGRSSVDGFRSIAGMWRRRPSPSSTHSCGPSPKSSCAWHRGRRTSRSVPSNNRSTATMRSWAGLGRSRPGRRSRPLISTVVSIGSKVRCPGPCRDAPRASGWAVVPWRCPGSSRGGSRRGCSRRSSPGLLRVPCSRACAAAGSRSWPPPWRPTARRRTGRLWPGSPRARARRSSPGSPSWGVSSASTSRTAPPARRSRSAA